MSESSPTVFNSKLSAWALLDQLRAIGIAVFRKGDDLSLTPRHLLTDDLRAAIRQHKSNLLECLQLEDPAPAYTPEEQAAYDAMRQQMAELLTSRELMEWLQNSWGCQLTLNDAGCLRAKHSEAVPEPEREVVRARHLELTEFLEENTVSGGGTGCEG